MERCIVCGGPAGWDCDCIEILEALANKEDRKAYRNDDMEIVAGED